MKKKIGKRVLALALSLGMLLPQGIALADTDHSTYDIKTYNIGEKNLETSTNGQVPPSETVQRIQGYSRYDTAIALSNVLVESADKVIIARGNNYADALAGSSLSEGEYPILLTPSDAVPENVLEEIRRLGSSEILLLGGELALSKNVENQLKDLGEVTRIAGDSRYDTARRIAEKSDRKNAIIVSGENFPDALSASALAAKTGSDIVLTKRHEVTQPTTELLTGFAGDYMAIAGGNLAIAEEVSLEIFGLTQRKDYDKKFSGQSRYDTSVQIAREFTENDTVIVATGQNYPDALAASQLAAKEKAPILLVKDRYISESIGKYLHENRERIDRLIIVGGEKAISKSVEDLLVQCIRDGGTMPELPKETTTTEPVLKVTYNPGEYRVIAKVTANFRKSNTTSSEKIGEVPKDTILDVLGSDGGNWLYVNYKEQKGWLHTDNLTPYNTQDSKKYVTTTDANFRKSNTTSSEKIGVIPKGTVLTILDSDGGSWRRVNYDGKTGWIHTDNLKEQTAEAIKYVTSEALNLRKTGSFSGEKISVIPQGTILTVQGTEGAWRQVTYNGNTGWVHSDYLREYNPDAAYKVVLSVPYISQVYPYYAWVGCEPTALLMGLKSKGYAKDVTLKKFLDDMPKTSSNPAKGFVGSPYTPDTSKRTTIYPAPLAAYGKKYGNVADFSGKSMKDIQGELYKGNPVVIYVTLYWEKARYVTYNIEGTQQSLLRNNHAVLVCGYDPETDRYYIADPYNRNTPGKDYFYWKSASVVEPLYNIRKHAVVVR